jgi:hypothetical protein
VGKEIKFVRVPDQETANMLASFKVDVPEDVEYVILVEPEPPLDRIAELEKMVVNLIMLQQPPAHIVDVAELKEELRLFVEKVEQLQEERDAQINTG